MSKNNRLERKARFIRLAEKRTTGALKAIRLIGNLSNRSHYEFDEEQIRQMFSSLGTVVDEERKRFRKQSVRPQAFKFDGN